MGLQRKVSFSLVVVVGVIISFTAFVTLEDKLISWWQYLILIFVTSVTVLPPFIWICACAAFTKVATELADDIEKVRNKK